MAELVPALPLETRCPPFALRRYDGFWLPEAALRRGIPALHAAGYAARPDDVLLASFPKSGTTWLKALAFSALNRVAHPPSAAGNHPLHRGNPHDLVPFLELSDELVAADYAGEDELYGELPSPRLLASHAPYSLLPHGVTTDC